MSAPKGYAICQGLGWLTYGAINWGFLRAGGLRGAPSFIVPLALSAGGVLLTHALRVHIRRQGWKGLSLAPLVVRLTLASLSLGFVLNAASLAVSWAAGWLPQVALSTFILYWFNLSVTFCLWQAIYFGVHLFTRTRAAELDRLTLAAAAREAELRLLKSQLNPHFLFNALNTVRGVISEDPAKAQLLLTGFANLLRSTLAAGQQHLVPLRHELELVRDYLAIEQARLEERLRVQWQVSPESLDAQVPLMLVQLLVENAIKHAIAPSVAGGTLSISAAVTAQGLEVVISHPRAPASAAEAVTGTRTGLRNVEERLRLLFGAAAKVALEHGESLTLASLWLPRAS